MNIDRHQAKFLLILTCVISAAAVLSSGNGSDVWGWFLFFAWLIWLN